MPKTTNLGLNLTTDDNTLFQTWRESIDGQGDADSLSNMQIIDQFAGNIYGVSGTVTLSVSFWTDNVLALSVSALGVNDAIFFSPVSALDKTRLETANCLVTAENNVVTFTAETAPTTDITLNYFIARGKA
jgi:hypothetical protein